MQLSNFAALDPYHQNRGVKGLRPPGQLAQQLWAEAQNDWDNIVTESESILESLKQADAEARPEDDFSTEKIYKPSPNLPTGPTEAERSVKVRLGQRFFRGAILANYRERCCVCHIPILELLIASHIIPWKDWADLRLNPTNGLCLCALHDKAFDRGLITITADYTVLISPVVEDYLPHEAIETGLTAYKARQILLPDRFLPDKNFLEIHRQEYFIK